MITAIVAWLVTYALHSSVLLGAVYLLERARVLVELDVRESAWRLAMFAPLATAALHVGFAAGAIDTAERRSESALAIAEPNPTPTPSMVGITLIKPDVASPTAHPVEAVSNRRDETFTKPVIARSVRVPFSPPGNLVAFLWMSMAGLGMGLLAWQFGALRRRFRAAPSCNDRMLVAEAAEIANKAGVSLDAIKQFSGETSTALVIPPATLCVPDWAVSDLKPSHRRAMIAHEVAHILRSDPWWRLSHRALTRALFFQPLNWVALRKLDEIAELACDRWAAENADRRALMECLVICGERILAMKQPALVSAMAASSSTLVARVQSLFALTPRLRGRVVAARGALALLLTAVLSLPVLIFETTALAAEDTQRSQSKGPWADWSLDDMRGTGLRVQSGSGLFDLGPKVTTMKVALSGAVIGARIRGDVEFSPAEDRVVALDGSLVIEERKGAVASRIEVDKADGAIRHRYRVDGKERPFEPEGRLFLARAAPTVLRESAFDAEARVDRILQRGVDALFAEVDLMHHDFARRVYLSKLMKKQQLDAGQVARVLDLIAPMDSDFERRTMLRIAIEKQTVEGANLVKMLDVVAAMDSDYEQRLVLTAASSKLASLSGDPAIVQAWSRAATAVDSDYEARLVISALGKNAQLEPALAEAALQAVVRIDSDYEARVTLAALASHASKTPALVAAYLAAANRIDSDFEKRLALTRIAKSAQFDTAGFRAIVESTMDIDSKFECQNVLRALLDQLPADPGAIDLYRNASKRCEAA